MKIAFWSRHLSLSLKLPAVLLLAILSIAAFNPCAQAGDRQKNILILNSYHVGYKWSDDIYNGILATLKPIEDELAFHIEYMDMKRHYSEDRYAHLANSFRQKYQNIPVDMIISADDAAFLFLQHYGSTLFPGVPVFFCGTNYLELTDLEGLSNFYGINEKADIDATIQTILELKPTTKRIYIINDTTITGQKVQRQIEHTISDFGNRVNFTIWKDISMADLITYTNNIPADSVVFYTFFFTDSTGQSFEYNQSMFLLYRQCPVPIFGAWDFNLNLGLVGGMLTSGQQQGNAVAQLALQYIQGTRLTDLPRLSSSPNRYMFDYIQLKRFTINPASLPEGSIIINQPVSFVQKHKPVLTIFGIFTTILILVIFFLAFNIYRRKQAEKELRQSEENFRGIFNNANDGLYQSSENRRFLRVNPALASLLKCNSPEEALAYYTDIDSQLYGSVSDRQLFRNTCDQTGWATGEHTLYCRDGSQIEVIEKIHTVSDESGNFLYYEGSITDITEYKKTQELITQTEKLISLGGVSAGIAHEIRSPISAIIQGSQVVQKRLNANNPTSRTIAQECGLSLDCLKCYIKKNNINEVLSDIHASGKRAGVIINDMLSFSRKSIGEFNMEALERIVNGAIELAKKDYTLCNDYNFRTIEILRAFDATVPVAFCSASKIQQVCFNILKNGAEAMAEAATPHPRFILRISATSDMAHVEIEDNGPGMDHELQKRIFEPFYTTKESKKGTGLGLSVSYYIIKENHHGSLTVDSQPGKGTKFMIRLPLQNRVSAP